jgi:hypothetical protein
MIIDDTLTNDELTKVVYQAIAAKHGVTTGYVKGSVRFMSMSGLIVANVHMETTDVPPSVAATPG